MAIVDWDVHHGNGTQDIFYDDPRVFYVSTHQSPLYPGTGRPPRPGEPGGPGQHELAGPGGHARRRVAGRVRRADLPVIDSFAPDWLIVSAGFDAHRDDPLAGLERTRPTTPTSPADSPRSCRRAGLLVVLEGGYDLDALTHSVGTTLGALVGVDYRPEPASTGEVGRPTFVAARQLWELN